MNERVKAILSTAYKLSLEEREELAKALLDTLSMEEAHARDALSQSEDVSGGAEEPPAQPTSDVLARYLEA